MGDRSVSLTRRRLLQAGAAMGGALLVPGLMQSVWAAGSDKPELEIVRVGFIPLTDCAPLIIAALKGFDKKYGITLVPTKEASWAAVRDKLVSGELDAAHVLYGLLYGLELGIASKPQPMANLMTLNQNGQAHAVDGAPGERHYRRWRIEKHDRRTSARHLHLCAYLSDRNACDVALLLAGQRGD